MPFINSKDLPKMELFPGALSGILAGENLMLSFLDLAVGGTVPGAQPSPRASWADDYGKTEVQDRIG